LHAYLGVGHLFTRKLDNQEDSFDPDPKVVADARTKGDQFLFKLGFLPCIGNYPTPLQSSGLDCLTCHSYSACAC